MDGDDAGSGSPLHSDEPAVPPSPPPEPEQVDEPGPPLDDLVPEEPDELDATPLPAALPQVVAVVVAHDPGDWFADTLASLRDQTYAQLAVLVIDAGSAEPLAPRIAEVAPQAFVRRIEDPGGWGAAANEVRGRVEGAAFYLFCHDDVALDPDAVRALVEEAFRSNAGIVGPKLVDWHDPARLRQVGATVDKTGVLSPFVEPGELDQEQHDAVRDVFVVPGGATLVRADLFEALGGFDDGIDFLGDDLDLCWRAHVAGARVMVAPAARVRHLEALGTRRPDDDRRRLLARHRLRSMLGNYGRAHRLRVLPWAMLFAFVEVLYALLSGDVGHARDVAGAWTWNLRRHSQIRRKRKQVKRIRRVPDHEVRELQARGSARLSAYVRGQIGRRDDRLSQMTRSGRSFAGTLRARSSRGAVVLALVTMVAVVVGSRNLLLRPIPVVGDLVELPGSARALFESWWSSYRPVGLGEEGPAPTVLGGLGTLGTALLGATGALRKLLIVGCLPVGLAGAWRLARPIGSLRAGIASFVVYASVPVAYNAFAGATWSGLVLYAVAPWMLLQIARASWLAPFGRSDLPDHSPEAAAAPATRTFGRQVLSLGVLLAVAAVLVPAAVPIAGVVVVAFVCGSLLSGGLRGSGRMVLALLAGAALAVVLHLPWAVRLLGPGAGWGAIAGIGADSDSTLSVADLLRFQSGPFGEAPLGYVFLVAAGLPLVIGQGWRFAWALRGWATALACWAVLWVDAQGWLPFPVPPAETLLAPAAAGLALSAAMGMAAFEVDLPGYRFGWRQAVSSAAALAVFVGVLPLLAGIVDGRWKMPQGGFDRSLSAVLAQDDVPTGRVLWVGDPEVVPAAGQPLDDAVVYATTEGTPGIESRFTARTDGADPLIGDALELAAERRTVRLGSLLAPMGVELVVVPVRDVPVVYGGVSRPVPPALLTVLGEQLDLAQVETDPGLVVYRNTAYAGPVVVVPPGADTDGPPTAAAGVDGWETALTDQDGPTSWSGSLATDADVLLAAEASDAWRLSVDGIESGDGEAYGWAQLFPSPGPGPAELEHATPPLHRVLGVLQALAWLVVLVLLRRSSPGRRLRRELRQAGEVVSGPAARLADPEGELVDVGVLEVPR